MKAYIGAFEKKNGEVRQMKFAKLCDLPKLFLEEKVKGGNKEKTMPPGMEVVWDLESKAFRVFNWKTTISEPETFEDNSLDNWVQV